MKTVDRIPPGRATFRSLFAILAAVVTAGAVHGEAFRFGPYQTTIADLAEPAAVIIDEAGRVYVTEPTRGQVSVFTVLDPEAPVVALHGDGRLDRPGGLALWPDGGIIVTDRARHEVVIIDDDGAFIRAWGEHGTKPGRFCVPGGVAVTDEHVLVADLGNDRIQIFQHDGDFVRAIGTSGSGDGEFSRPVDVDVDGAGAIYVADADNNRIQKFAPDGSFVRSWGDWGPFRGLFDEPTGVTCRDGLVHVVDRRNHRVQSFDPDGELVERWGVHAVVPHEGDGKLHYPNGLAVAPDGSFAAIAESFENRVQIFARAEPSGEDGPSLVPLPPKVRSHFGERLAADGKLLTMAEPENHRVYVFEMSRAIPIIIGEFGARGRTFGQFVRLGGLEFDLESRRLFVSDSATHLLQAFLIEYDPDAPRGFAKRRGKLLNALDLEALTSQLDDPRLSWTIEASAIERDANGNLYLIDARNDVIVVLDDTLRYSHLWGGRGDDHGRFRRPTDVAVTDDGRVLVVDADNQRVQIFDPEGRFLRAWGWPGDEPGGFVSPFGITVDGEGFAYVTDTARQKVMKFRNADGKFIREWGELGVDHGQFWKPGDIECDDEGRLIVVDFGNHRAQIFDREGAWLVSFGTGRAYTTWDESPGALRKESP